VRRWSIAAAIWLSWPPAAIAQEPAPDAGFRILDAVDPCTAVRAPDEIVVCGNRLERDRYRITQLGESPAAGTGYVRGEVPRASAEPAVSGGCGLFQGQRRCSETEMAEFGYGEGRDPITFATKLVARLADPDAGGDERDSHFQARDE